MAEMRYRTTHWVFADGKVFRRTKLWTVADSETNTTVAFFETMDEAMEYAGKLNDGH